MLFLLNFLFQPLMKTKQLFDQFFFSHRCVRPIRRPAHRESAGEVPVRPRRVLSEPVPQPTHAVRQAPPQASVPPHRQFTSHRTTLLRTTSREDAYRDPDQGYAALRQFILVAVHGDHVTYDVATPGSCLIHALRLLAVSAEPALRPLQIRP